MPAANLNTIFENWREAQHLGTGLCFDNRPVGVAETFPPIETPQTEGQLAESLWWWRKVQGDGRAQVFHQPDYPHWPGILTPLYEDYFERSAYLYEFRARYNRREWDFNRPWAFVSQEQRRFLGCLWPQNNPPRNWNQGEADNPAFVRLHRSFNLELNDTELQRQFMEEIAKQREESKIEKQDPHSVSHRAMSWRPIELLDIRHYKIRELNESERSQLSKAVQTYKLACQNVDLEP